MITVTILRESGRAVGFDCHGHAGFDNSGRDIVCSAVSALIQTTANGITEIAKVPAAASMDDDEGIHVCIARDATDAQMDQTQLLIDTMVLGLQTIVSSYPKYLKIIDREV